MAFCICFYIWVILWILAIVIRNTKLGGLIFRLRVSSIKTCLVGAWADLDRVFSWVDQTRVLGVVCREEALTMRSLDFFRLLAVLFSTTLTICVDLVISLLGMFVKVLVKLIFLMELWFCHNFWLLILRFSGVIVSWIALLIGVFKRLDIWVSLALYPVPGIVVTVSWGFGWTRIEHLVLVTFIFVIRIILTGVWLPTIVLNQVSRLSFPPWARFLSAVLGTFLVRLVMVRSIFNSVFGPLLMVIVILLVIGMRVGNCGI